MRGAEMCALPVASVIGVNQLDATTGDGGGGDGFGGGGGGNISGVVVPQMIRPPLVTVPSVYQLIGAPAAIWTLAGPGSPE